MACRWRTRWAPPASTTRPCRILLEYEQGGVPADVVAALEAMGYKTQAGATGSLTAIEKAAGGWEGMFDPRKHGLAAGY